MAITFLSIVKVLYLLHQTYATGGSTRSFLSLIGELRRLGVEVHVAMPDQEGVYDTLVEEKFKVVTVPFRYGTYPDCQGWVDRLLFLPRLMARRLLLCSAVNNLCAYVVQNDIDLIHSNSSVLDLGFFLSRKTRVPHVLHIREYGDADFGYRYYPNWTKFHRHLDAPEQYSFCITRDVQRYHGLADHPRSWVVYNGICRRLSYRPKQVAEPYFLYVGRIQETKGLIDVVAAYGQYVHSCGTSMSLKIAGKVCETDYYKRVIALIRELKLDSSIEFLGEVSDAAPLMSSAQALIVPSLSEGFGRCMAEGMFCGCPVIVRQAGGLSEQLSNGLQRAGREIALSFESVDQLAKAMQRVVAMEPLEREAMADAAFQTVNDLYSIESCAQQVLAKYEEICR